MGDPLQGADGGPSKRSTKPLTGYNTRRSWEESNTAEQGWAGESQSSFGPKPQVSRGSPWWWKRSHEWNRTVTSSRLFPSANKEHGPVGRTSLTWADIWRTPQAWFSFLMRAVYDTLPCPRNLSQWFGSEECPMCIEANTGLQHILSGCNVALT